MIQNTTDSSFSYYEPVNEVYFSDFIFENDNRMVMNGATINSPYYYNLIKTFPKAISKHYNITSSSFTFINKSDASYPVVSGTLINSLFSDYDMTEYALTQTYDTHTYLSGANFYKSEVSYWYGNTTYVRELQGSTYYEIDLYLTCSVSGSTTIGYALTSDDNGTVPSWITLDTSDRKLKFTTPELDADTNFTFSVEAVVSGDTNTYVNNYYLEVLHVNITNNT